MGKCKKERSIADERPIAMLLFLVMVSGLGPLIIIEVAMWWFGID